MKHLLQNLSSGNTSIVNAPDPTVDKNSIIVAASCSLISVGTERMLVDFGKASLLNKAVNNPKK